MRERPPGSLSRLLNSRWSKEQLRVSCGWPLLLQSLSDQTPELCRDSRRLHSRGRAFVLEQVFSASDWNGSGRAMLKSHCSTWDASNPKGASRDIQEEPLGEPKV